MATLSVIRRWALRERLSIREIARRTGLSRNTIKKYLAAGVVEPRYAKRVSPSKLDAVRRQAGHVADRARRRKSRKQQRTIKQMHADLVALGFDRLLRPRSRLRASMACTPARSRANHRPRQLRAPDLRPRRSLPVRLERRLGRRCRRTHEAAGRALQAQPQPRVPAARLPAANARDAVRRPQPRLRGVRRCAPARHLRQHEDGRGQGAPRQGARHQPALCGDGQPLPVRARVLQPGRGLGEGPGREERARCAAPAVATGAGVRQPGCLERLARSTLQGAVDPDRAQQAARHRGRRVGRRASVP